MKCALGRRAWVLWCVAAACGGRSQLSLTVDASVPEVLEARPEVCNGLDDDLDGRVDQPWRDDRGRYVSDEHCGGCGRPCSPGGNVLEARCEVRFESARCVAVRCVDGMVPSRSGACVPRDRRLCLPCVQDEGCGDFEGARCVQIGGESRCTVDCALGCAEGYRCDPAEGVCVPVGGSCGCGPGDRFDLACLLPTEGGPCVGRARCEDGVLSACEGRAEVCNEVDDDCDGLTDEGFRDDRGAYSLDVRNCGGCGVDCTVDDIPGVRLTCGGDPFAPSCVVRCPDLDDGLDPGDRVDADRDVATGCECTVRSVEDEPGPVGAEGDALDTNCDGADGVVLESFYVAPDGDDAGPGSPSRPLRTVSEALRRASESIATERPRPHVYVAAGVYVEVLQVPDGVHVHGGYRRDFRALEPAGFRSEVRAPADAETPGGAAAVLRAGGLQETTLEGLVLRGADASESSTAAFGVYVVDPWPGLTLRNLEVRAGRGGPGVPGHGGAPGVAPAAPGSDGEPPRGAVEDAAHRCRRRDVRNRVRGGAGSRHTCGDVDVSGGDGGSTGCPRFAETQEAGESGRGPRGLSGGSGGRGGQDSRGPISADRGSCQGMPVCCGLADFTVPTDFRGPAPGQPGQDGRNGRPGASCSDPLGRLRGDRWEPEPATAGTAGSPGSGGGGGGGGGGAEMDWFDGLCEFSDGLGGGGGGGGAGGCGGHGGAPGTSAGPSVALVMRYTGRVRAGAPRLEGLLLWTADGAPGGDGGAGGEGALGSAGGQGGALPREARSTPTLAGPFPGGRGGPGGQGGSGGGGGAGCGGASVGIWVAGMAPSGLPIASWRGGLRFRLGRPGRGGRGGGGPSAAPNGADGVAMEVVVR